MPKLLQINVTANWGSTGKIAEQIGQMAIQKGWDSYIAYGRMMNPSKSKLIKIGTNVDVYLHYLVSRLWDAEGLASKRATRKLTKEIDRIKPDIVHLHNIHDHYLNYPVLFEYLANNNIPVVWTQHDQWATTGHCAFNLVGCDRWKMLCHDCPECQRWSLDRSKRNYLLKKKLFSSVRNLTVVSVSDWLNDQIKASFLGQHSLRVIKNGVDTDVFKPTVMDVRKRYGIGEKKIILGVASVWSKMKGLEDFDKLSRLISDEWVIVLVGHLRDSITSDRIIHIERTQNQLELAQLYSASHVLVSLSRSETFGLTIVEGMACGTPAIVCDNTAQPELVTDETGAVVKENDIDALLCCIERFKDKTVEVASRCRERAEKFFKQNSSSNEYISLYNRMLGGG